jgi:aminopeptidase N
VEPGELFAAFEHTVVEYQYDLGQNVTVTGFMKQWTEQAGHPMIDVVKVNDTFVITQVRT